MSKTLSFTASTSSVTTAAQSNWSSWSVCQQGAYNGNTRVGALLFSSLRSSSWSSKSISQITLTLTFTGAGSNSTKTLGMYQGTKTSFTGTGTAMLGTSIGSVSTGGTAYNSTRTITFNSSTNATAFANLVSWLKNTSSLTLAFYVNESASSGYSTNYLQINSATLAVTYTSGTIKYATGGSFVDCEVYYATGGSFVKVVPYYGSGGSFIEIG